MKKKDFSKEIEAILNKPATESQKKVIARLLGEDIEFVNECLEGK